MRVTVKYTYPEKGTRNGRIYSQEVLEKAFNKPAFKELCGTKALPILSEDDKFIGTGTATLEDKRVVVIDGEIFDSTYIKLLKDFKDRAAFTLAGTGVVEHTDDKAVVTEVAFTHAMLTTCPAVDCKEIQYED